MTIQLLGGIYFLAVSFFGLYSMHKNDDVVNNRWLFLCGWFLWGCMMCIATNTFLTYAINQDYFTTAQLESVSKGFTAIAYSPIAAVTFSIAFLFYSMYLFSLRKRCMEAELIPRTFRIWLIRTWRRIFKRHIYHKPRQKQYAISNPSS